MSQEFARTVEERLNEVVEQDLPVRVLFLPRAEADRDPSLIRLKANLISRSVDPLRVIDIVGLDRQAEEGRTWPLRPRSATCMVKAASKGKANKRIRIALDDFTRGRRRLPHVPRSSLRRLLGRAGAAG